ncbi:MAG: NAD(+) synthase [Candidatus Diapherotrites archaeon]|nr:NAD(+) synthase [Candidatus Diapherotrites archaeon]
MKANAADLFAALVSGLRGYAKKHGFSKAVLGLSGGVDSSVVACIGAKSLGAKNVLGVALPSKFNSAESLGDARALAQNLGIDFKEWSIEEIVELNRRQYARIFGEHLSGVADENPQARLRANALMTISNAQGRLLLGTGNRTELALGYCTLHGDMAAGVSVIGNVNKADVYQLAEYINKTMGNPIPKSVIAKKPSAELASGQFDPFDYAVVSPLADLVLEGKTDVQLAKAGFSKELVSRIKSLVVAAEYKRKQAAPSLPVKKKPLGSAR